MGDNDWARGGRLGRGMLVVRTKIDLWLDKTWWPSEQRREFWWTVVRIQRDQPWADGLMQRSLFGQSGDTGPDGVMVNGK
jgi:hypothetical protein